MGVIYKNGTYYGGGSGGGGAEITIDNELSSTSENPVQNKVIKAELDNKQDADDLMTSADMDDVVTPLPGVSSRLPRYSTEEQIVGYWIDGKPLYQKTFVISNPPDSTDISSLHIADAINGFAVVKSTDDGSTDFLNYVHPQYTTQYGIIFMLLNNNTTLDFRSNGRIRANLIFICTLQYTKTTD